MGLGIAVGGGIISATIVAVLSIMGSTTFQMYDLNSAQSATTDQEIKMSHTNITISSLYPQSGSSLVSFSLSNAGNEKLWNYDSFDMLVTYDADVGSILTPMTEKLTYNSSQAFAQDGHYINNPQFARPDMDVAVGGWTDAVGGNGDGINYNEISETSRNDGNFTRSDLLLLPDQTDTWQVGLSDVTDPQTFSDHVVRYVYRKDADLGVTVNLTVRLLEGSNTVTSWAHNNLNSTFTLATQTLSAVTVSSISDYSNLQLEFIASHGGGLLPGRSADVSWAELEVPSASQPYDCSTVTLSSKQWTIDRIRYDDLDPRILNSNEDAAVCIVLSNPLFAGGDIDVVVTTDAGITKISSANAS